MYPLILNYFPGKHLIVTKKTNFTQPVYGQVRKKSNDYKIVGKITISACRA